MGRRRSKSPKGNRRDRSRDRDNYSSRYNDDNRSHSSSSRGNSRGIEALKNHMKSALDDARRELSEASTSYSDTRREEHNLSASDAARRTREIERIESETGGFRPAEFKSTAGGAGGRMRKDGSGASETEKKQRAHERAIYGPSARCTASASDDSAAPSVEPPKDATFELAHPRLSEDPEERNKRWLALLREQRKELLC
ncbi:hypothetical protein QR680_018335 [Steinernema hermaphroditum]|uniref:Uncharacterized protein n=1 Tax=Steinernema hermaphroditum TaxID=289476 RepID=A0AA39HHM3_9BILA|nr:hypothetical protein QR680_018335 [Steinernema hermaphroditum]